MKQVQTKRLARFLLPDCRHTDQVVELSAELMHHASRVLRIKDKSHLRIWNGRGEEFLGQLDYLSKKEARVTVLEGPHPLVNHELSQALCLLQALPEGDKMDWIFEKSTELGVQAFFPVQAERSVVKLQGERIEKRQAHWEKVVQAASLQAERGQLPKVHGIARLEQALTNLQTHCPQAHILWFNPTAPKTLVQWLEEHTLEPETPLVICVGPEGGWTPDETALASRHQAVNLKLSNRILRTETFALACVSQLTALLKLDQSA